MLASISPTSATERNLTWESSDKSIATVTNGLVKGVKAGNAIIVVKSADGKVSATCQVIVNNAPVPTATTKPTPVPTTPPGVKVTKVSLGITQTSKYVNDTLQLSTTVQPSSVTSYKVQWSSSNPDVATVSNNGLVTTKKVGTAVITATVDGVKASCNIIVRERTTPSTPTNKPTTVPTSPTKPTTAPTTGPTTAPTTAAEFTFDKKYVNVSTQSVSINKGGTASVKVKLKNAAGLFAVKSSNTGIATVNKDTVWLDGVDEDSGEPYWAEKEFVITGTSSGTTTIVITPGDAGIATYDTSKELTGKIVINVQVK